MRILKVYPLRDTYRKYNYHVNYGLWDAIDGDSTILESFDANLNNYDVVFLPMYSRWKGHWGKLNEIKNHKIKTVLFDNDSYYRVFGANFYKDIDLIFYRCVDKEGKKPQSESAWLPWSIDTNLYPPSFGGEGVLFSCSSGKAYPVRQEVSKIITRHQYMGNKYIEELQRSGAAIHTTSRHVTTTHAKVLEFAACGTQIISNRSDNMNYYFPDELILYFDSIDDLKNILNNYSPNIEIQKELRRIVEQKHDNKIRLHEVLNKISYIL